jgi:8-oxo-dGTP diphosphatase
MPKRIDKIAWIHIDGRKILSARSRGKDTFYIPGGKREAGETDIQTLVREIREELGVDIRPGSERHLGTFEAPAHGYADGTLVRMTCYTADFTGELRPDSEIEEVGWLRHADRDRSAPVDRIILDWLNERDLIQ